MRGTGNDFLMIKIRDVHRTPTKRKKSVQRKRNLIRKFILNSLSQDLSFMPCVKPPCLSMLRNAGKHPASCLWQDLVKLKTSVVLRVWLVAGDTVFK